MATSQVDQPPQAPSDPFLGQASEVHRQIMLWAALSTLIGVFIAIAIWQVSAATISRQVRKLRLNYAASGVSDKTPLQGMAENHSTRLSVDSPPAADAQLVPPKSRMARVEKSAPDIQAFQNPPMPLANLVNPLVNSSPIADATRPSNPSIANPSIANPANSPTSPLQSAAKSAVETWEDYGHPSHFSAPETSKARMTYISHRNRVLNAITISFPNSISLEMARKDYLAARAVFAEDPRLDYAYGLVLWKHSQFDQAIEAFQIAANRDHDPYLPASLAVAWGQCLMGDERRGLNQLLHVAQLIESQPRNYPTDSQRKHASLLMGRAIGYLTRPANSPEFAETVKLSTLTIMERLPPELRSIFESGRDQISQRQTELQQLALNDDGQVFREYQQSYDDVQRQITSIRNDIRDARHELDRGHRSRLNSITGILKDILDVRAKVEKLEPTLKQLKDRITQLAIPKPHVEIKTMPGHYHLIMGPGGQTQLVQNNATMAIAVAETAAERSQRRAELSSQRENLRQIQSDLTDLREQQRMLVEKRQNEDRAAKLEKEAERKQRVSRLEEQRALEQRLRLLNSSFRKARSLRAGLETIAAYIPWNIDAEGEALSQSLTSKTQMRD